MMAHPLALQLRTLQTLVEIGVDKNTMVVVPAPLVSTIQELRVPGQRDRGRHRAARPRQRRDQPLAAAPCRARRVGGLAP